MLTLFTLECQLITEIHITSSRDVNEHQNLVVVSIDKVRWQMPPNRKVVGSYITRTSWLQFWAEVFFTTPFPLPSTEDKALRPLNSYSFIHSIFQVCHDPGVRRENWTRGAGDGRRAGCENILCGHYLSPVRQIHGVPRWIQEEETRRVQARSSLSVQTEDIAE